MRIVRRANHDRIDALVLFLEHLAEVAVLLCPRELVVRARRPPIVHVAEGDDVLAADGVDVAAADFSGQRDAGEHAEGSNGRVGEHSRDKRRGARASEGNGVAAEQAEAGAKPGALHDEPGERCGQDHGDDGCRNG